jgi:hypothetical protein
MSTVILIIASLTHQAPAPPVVVVIVPQAHQTVIRRAPGIYDVVSPRCCP